MKYTIINLTRLGDLLQSQPLIKALKDSGKASKVSLICLENFLGATDFIEELDHVATLPVPKLLSELDFDWRFATNTFHEWVKKYTAEFPTDVLINLTPSLSGKLLARLVPAKEYYGFCLDEHGFSNDSSPWVTYTQAVTLNRGCSPYNLVDCFLKILNFSAPSFSLKKPEKNLLDTIAKELEVQTSQILQTLTSQISSEFDSSDGLDISDSSAHKKSYEKPKGYVGFQLGASNRFRQWSLTSFAELGKLLWEKERILPILLGSKAEQALANEYLSTKAPAINMCGKTDVKELAAVLLQCRLLVSNDTGTMHLAAGLNVPTIGIFLHTAQAWDTGPFQGNCICLEPKLACHPCSFGTTCPHDHKCISSIPMEALWEIVQGYLQKGSWEDFYPIAAQSARVWQTYFDSFGFMNLKSLSDDEKENRTIWIRYQRIFYRELLHGLIQNNSTQNQQDIEQETIFENPYAGQEFLPFTSEFRDTIRNTLMHGVKLLLLLEGQAALLSSNPSPKMQENFISSISRFSILFSHSPEFISLSVLWKVALQENANSIHELIHFFGTLRKKMQEFYEIIPSNNSLV